MQYVTSMLNKWGQFLTTVVVASKGCYARMARGLVFAVPKLLPWRWCTQTTTAVGDFKEQLKPMMKWIIQHETHLHKMSWYYFQWQRSVVLGESVWKLGEEKYLHQAGHLPLPLWSNRAKFFIHLQKGCVIGDCFGDRVHPCWVPGTSRPWHWWHSPV